MHNISLTRNTIVNPVLWLRAEGVGYSKARQFIEAQLVARVVAVFTSVMAVLDATMHLAMGIFKGTGWVLGKCFKIHSMSLTKFEIQQHFKNFGFFIVLTLVGSVAGTIWPGVFKNLQLPYLIPPEVSLSNLHDLPEIIKELSQKVTSGEIKSPYDKLKDEWSRFNLLLKHWFVQIFRTYTNVTQEMAPIVYRSYGRHAQEKVNWVSDTIEIAYKIKISAQNVIAQGYFYHATNQAALESILKTKTVQVCHQKLYRGAFVSTRPELRYGNCILVFKKNIERLSALNHGFTVDNGEAYWAGFSQNIPVNKDTLAYVLVYNLGVNIEKFTNHLKELAGRDIKVIDFDYSVNNKIEAIQNLNCGIPSEWGEEDGATAQKIQQAMLLEPQQDTIKLQVYERQGMLLAN